MIELQLQSVSLLHDAVTFATREPETTCGMRLELLLFVASDLADRAVDTPAAEGLVGDADHAGFSAESEDKRIKVGGDKFDWSL